MRVFILGNGPTLPVDDLHLLAGEQTIGVNRIGLVYTPTVLFWADCSDKWDPDGRHTRLDCFRVTACRRDFRAGRADKLLTRCSARAKPETWTDQGAYLGGSSAAAAARWAWCRGFRDIICLGMGGTGGHFYGGEDVYPRHAAMFARDYARLRRQLGDSVRFVDSVSEVMP